MIQKYIKIEEVEALQFTGDNILQCQEFCSAITVTADNTLWLKYYLGLSIINSSEYIVKNLSKNTFEIYKQKDFNRIFKLAENNLNKV